MWSRFNQILREAVGEGGDAGAGGVEAGAGAGAKANPPVGPQQPVTVPVVGPAVVAPAAAATAAAAAAAPSSPTPPVTEPKLSLIGSLMNKVGLTRAEDGSLTKTASPAPASPTTPSTPSTGDSNGQAASQTSSEDTQQASGDAPDAPSSSPTPPVEAPESFSFDGLKDEGAKPEGATPPAQAADGDGDGAGGSGEGTGADGADTGEEPAAAGARATEPTDEVTTPPPPTPEEIAAIQELKTLLDDSLDLSDDKLELVRRAYLATARGKRQLQAFKFVRDLALPVADGGIGVEPTQNDIKAWYGSHRQLDMIRYGMESGSVEDAVGSLTALFGSSTDDTLPPPPAVSTVVGQLIPYLVNHHPDLYREHISAPIRRAVVNHFVKFVQELPHGADESTERKYHDAAIFSAQLLEERMFGQSRPTEAFLNGSAAAAPGASPAKTPMEVENENLRRQIATQSTDQITLAQTQFYDNLESAARVNQEKFADFALSPLARQHGADSETYLGIRDRFIKQAVHAINQNSEFASQYSRDVNRVWGATKRALASSTPIPSAQRQQAQRELVQKLDRVTKSAMTTLRPRFINRVAAVAATPNNGTPGSAPPSNSTAQSGTPGSSVGQATNSPVSPSPAIASPPQGQQVPVTVAAGVDITQGVQHTVGRNVQQDAAAYLRGKMTGRMGQVR